MKKREILMVLLIILLQAGVYGQDQIIVNADLGKTTISKHIYGHFSEHLGRCIYGGFYVGEDNTRIPHTRGIRKDVVEALKVMQIPNLRWPGGCFADTYHWKDGIGPKSSRPTIVNTWWGGVTEDNSFGTHEFLDLCEMLGTEPYLAGNVGSGTTQELSDWVQYVNFNGQSPMSALREQNGRKEPWKVRYWGVGNEVWGCGGNMKPEYYANIYRQYATFMNANWGNDERIFRIASGANSSDYNWTEVLMRDIPHNLLEGVALHHYSVIDWGKKGSDTDFSEEQYFTTMKRALLMEELVRKHSTIMDKYDPTGRVALIVDEWGGWYDVAPGTNPAFLYQQNTMRDAMIAGASLNIFNNQAKRVRMANLAQTVNVLQAVVLTDEEKMLLTPTYHVMEMYKVHHDATLLPLEVKSGYYIYEKEQLPAISASASKDAQGNMHISLVNIDAKQSHKVTMEIRGATFTTAKGRILTSAKIQDHNTFDKPNTVKPVEFSAVAVKGNTIEVNIPPFSVIVLAVK